MIEDDRMVSVMMIYIRVSVTTNMIYKRIADKYLILLCLLCISGDITDVKKRFTIKNPVKMIRRSLARRKIREENHYLKR